MSLQEDLLRLGILDQKAVFAVSENNIETLMTAVSEYQALRKRIRSILLPQSLSLIEDTVASDILKKITTGKGLPTDRIIEHMHYVTGSDQLPGEFSDKDLDTLGSDLFYSWFSHIEYITGLSELRPLVVSTPIRKNIGQLVEQIKNCYAFQQYEATYSLCRTVIEASIRDICVRCNLFPDRKDSVVLFEKITWWDLKEKVSSGSLKDDLDDIYSKLSEVLHARKAVSKDDAYLAFKKTLIIIEKLYNYHGL